MHVLEANFSPISFDQKCIQDDTGARCVDNEETPIWTPPDPKPTPSETPIKRVSVMDELSGDVDIPLDTDEKDDEIFTAGDLGYYESLNRINITVF